MRLENLNLRSSGGTEGGRRGSEFSFVEMEAGTTGPEQLFDCLRHLSLTIHPEAEVRARESSIAHGTYPIQDRRRPLRKLPIQPFNKEILDSMRQADDRVPGMTGASFRGQPENRGNFLVIERRYDRTGVHADWYSCRGKCLDCLKSFFRRGGSRLHDPDQASIKGRDGDRHGHEIELCKWSEKIDVTLYQSILCNDEKWIAVPKKDLETSSCNPEALFNRLIAVSIPRHHDGLGLPGSVAELLLQESWRIAFYHDFRLKIETRGKPEVFMSRPRITIDAAMLAPAIRIETVRESNVGAFILRQDRPSVILIKSCGDLPPRFGIFKVWRKLIGDLLNGDGLETVRRIGIRSPAPRRRYRTPSAEKMR